MNPLNATFVDYQAKHKSSLPCKAQEALTYVQIKVRIAVAYVDDKIQVPEFIVRIVQLAVTTFSLCPLIDPLLELPKQLCKDAKNFTNVVKGLKSVDGFLHFKFHWKAIVMNFSGLTLFIVSGLSLVDRFKFLDVTPIKTSLSTIPVFGILPWGGFLPLSVVGLMGMISLFTVEKLYKLKENEERITVDKLPFWSEPLDLAKVNEKQVNYTAKILDLQAEIAAYKDLIEEGAEVEDDLIQRADHPTDLYACQKAMAELNKSMEKAQEILQKTEYKQEKWDLLEKNWSAIDPQELENLRQAKQAKWEKKLDKIAQEKRLNYISVANNVIILGRQALLLIGVASGYGIITLPLVVNVGLDAYVAGAGVKTFLMKRAIKQIKIPSEELTTYVNLYAVPGKAGLIESACKDSAAAA